MDLFSKSEVAEMLDVTVRTVTNLISRGELSVQKVKTGNVGRPRTMVTASSYGACILRKRGKRV